MVLALQCVPVRTEVHLFGYNWTPQGQFKLHRLAFEERYAALMAVAGRVTIHPPPCGGLRQCDSPPKVSVRTRCPCDYPQRLGMQPCSSYILG